MSNTLFNEKVAALRDGYEKLGDRGISTRGILEALEALMEEGNAADLIGANLTGAMEEGNAETETAEVAEANTGHSTKTELAETTPPVGAAKTVSSTVTAKAGA